MQEPSVSVEKKKKKKKKHKKEKLTSSSEVNVKHIINSYMHYNNLPSLVSVGL